MHRLRSHGAIPQLLEARLLRNGAISGRGIALEELLAEGRSKDGCAGLLEETEARSLRHLAASISLRGEVWTWKGMRKDGRVVGQ
jgi:hypothetical protein